MIPLKILRVRVHRASRPAVDRQLQRLFDELNQTETIYPGTDLRLVYELVGNPVPATEEVSTQFPPGKEV